MNRRKLLKYTLTVSILLHVLFFSAWALVLEYDLFPEKTTPENIIDNAPLVFELEESKLPKQVIETPDDAQIDPNQDRADYLSDKSALARNFETNSELPVDAPFARGDLNVPELPSNNVPPGELQPQSENSPEPKQEKKDARDESGDYFAANNEEFSREYLVKPQNNRPPGASESSPRVRYDNQETRAEDVGGLSFNTYDWDFAPYMLALKKKVERNIFPPPAFTRMGLISGDTVLRFKIYPGGEMRDLELLGYEGHRTLMETSMRAIEISVPFPPLPNDFPERYLEVTAKFSYFIPKVN